MTLYFNGGTQPLVPCVDGWGEGVVMPGYSFETDAVLGPPWTEDAEAAAAIVTVPDPGAGDPSGSAADGHSEPQVTPEPPVSGAPTLHTLDSGDVVNEAGVIVGHEEVNQPSAQAPGGNI